MGGLELILDNPSYLKKISTCINWITIFILIFTAIIQIARIRIDSALKDLINRQLEEQRIEKDGIIKQLEEQKENLSKLNENNEKSQLIKIVPHDRNSNLMDLDMQGQMHKLMGPYTLTLPPAAPGLHGYFVSEAKEVFHIKPYKNDHIVLWGNPIPNGNKVTSDGSKYATLYVSCWSENTWDAHAINSIFVDGGT